MEKDRFDLDRYSKFLKEQAKIIREHPLDVRQIGYLFDQFIKSLQILTPSSTRGDLNLLQEALSEFALATQIAYSKYRTQNKNLWVTLFGFAKEKLPEINVQKLLNLLR